MKYSLENYWKNIYQRQSDSKYINQSFQSIEIIEWHKEFIENQNSIFNRNFFARKIMNLQGQQEFTLSLFSKEQFFKFSHLAGLKITQYEYIYVLPKSLGFLRSLINHFLPSSFSHHIFVEMQHI